MAYDQLRIKETDSRTDSLGPQFESGESTRLSHTSQPLSWFLHFFFLQSFFLKKKTLKKTTENIPPILRSCYKMGLKLQIIKNHKYQQQGVSIKPHQLEKERMRILFWERWAFKSTQVDYSLTRATCPSHMANLPVCFKEIYVC